MTRKIDTHGIQINLWKNLTECQRVTAIAYLKAHAPLMVNPSPAAVRIMETCSTGTQQDKANPCSKIDAERKERLLKNHLGKIDTRLLWTVICHGEPAKVAAEWLFGSTERDAKYAARRVKHALAEAALVLGTTKKVIIRAKKEAQRAA